MTPPPRALLPLWLPALTLGLAACGAVAPDADLRDIRPTQIQRDDVVTVEALRAVFMPGAPATVTFAWIRGADHKPLTVTGRAVSRTRVLFDADRAFERAVASLPAAHDGHVLLGTTIAVSQKMGTQDFTWVSAPTLRFEMDFFPVSLQRSAQKLSDRVAGGGALWSWLGVTVDDVKTGGVRVQEVESRMLVDHPDLRLDKRGFFSRYDLPPLDGRITREEAKIGQPGGLTEDEFARLDTDKNGRIEGYEADEHASVDGLAAAAGLKRGDLITAANGKPVARVADLAAAWDRGDSLGVQLTVTRGVENATISLPRFGHPAGIPVWIFFALAMILAATLVALPVPVVGGLIVVWERKISAYMQSRIGPNRVGPGGWLQWLADGLKLIMKEDLIPSEADPILFKLSPFLAFVGLFLVFVVIPFSGWVIVADLDIGLLFLLSVTSLVVVSIIMGGWSSNSKWSLLGGMRSAAQIISYELPASVALLGVATFSGSLSTQAIVRAQGGMPWHWFLFHNPFTFVAFFIYFISALAEGNRTPFDLPEAESELVSGYNTEYSGFRFALFPLVEWVNVFVVAAVASMLFLGGWRLPHVTLAAQDASGWLQLCGALVFLAKTIALIFVIIWIRWTLPRFRVDQMMNLCWKFFIPISFGCFIGNLLIAWLLPNPWALLALHVATFVAGGCIPAWIFVKKVQYNRSRYQELRLNPLL